MLTAQAREAAIAANDVTVQLRSKKLNMRVVFSYKVGWLRSTTRGSCCKGLLLKHVKEGEKVFSVKTDERIKSSVFLFLIYAGDMQIGDEDGSQSSSYIFAMPGGTCNSVQYMDTDV